MIPIATLTTAISSGDKSYVDALEAHISQLIIYEGRWHKAYLWLIFATVLLSLAMFFAQYFESRFARQRADAESELNRVKDRIHTAELRVRDGKIAETAERAGKLEVQAASAQAGIAQANVRAKEAEAKVASADAASKEAVSKVAASEARIAEANRAAAEANATAERERLARLQLESRLADRTLTTAQQTRLAEALRPFSGTEVDVVIFGDTPEIGIISGMVLDCMRRAGWNVHTGNAGAGMVVRGILVGVRPNSPPAITDAAGTLVSVLQSAGISSGPWQFDQMPYPSMTLNTSLTHKTPIKVFIGSKPQ